METHTAALWPRACICQKIRIKRHPSRAAHHRWGRSVIVYGPAALSRAHPVVAFLTAEGRAAALAYFREGFGALEAKFPFLATASLRQGCYKR